MLFQTVINHDIEFKAYDEKNIDDASYLTATLHFSIKNQEDEILNNSITLKNFLRTSKDFRDFVAELFLKNLSVPANSFTVPEREGRSVAYIYSSSKKKMTITFHITPTEDFISKPHDFIENLLRRPY